MCCCLVCCLRPNGTECDTLLFLFDTYSIENSAKTVNPMFYLINDIDLGEFDVSKAQSITTKDGARFNTS